MLHIHTHTEHRARAHTNGYDLIRTCTIAQSKTKCFKWWFHLQFGLQFCFVFFSQHIYIFVCFFNCILSAIVFISIAIASFFYFTEITFSRFVCALNDKCEFIWLLEATDLYFFFFLFFPLVIWWPYLYNTTDDCLWFVAKTVNKSLEYLRYIAHHSVCLQQTKSIILDEIHCFVILYLPQPSTITRMVWFHQRPVKVYNCHRNEA